MTQTVDRAILDDIATANRILFHQGVVDAFGHVSLRHPDRPDHFLLARNMAPGSVTADDILELDAESEPVDPTALVRIWSGSSTGRSTAPVRT